MKNLEYLPSIEGFKLLNIPSAEEFGLPVVISSLGFTGKEGNISWRGTKYIIVYSHKGCGKAFINNRWHFLPEGSLLFMSRGEPAIYHPVNNDPWSTYYITFNGPGVKNFINIPSAVINHPDLGFIPNFVEKSKEKIEDEDLFAFIQGGLVYTLQLIKHHTLNIFDQKITTFDSSILQTRISESIKYFSELFNKDISVESLAEKCGISVQYYCRLFKAQTGSTPMAYIKALRITRACELLNNEPTLNIKNIAEKCGFQSINYFNKTFKETMGMTPSQYRAINNE